MSSPGIYFSEEWSNEDNDSFDRFASGLIVLRLKQLIVTSITLYLLET